jgi:hypothetical protein
MLPSAHDNAACALSILGIDLGVTPFKRYYDREFKGNVMIEVGCASEGRSI